MRNDTDSDYQGHCRHGCYHQYGDTPRALCCDCGSGTVAGVLPLVQLAAMSAMRFGMAAVSHTGPGPAAGGPPPCPGFRVACP